MPEPKIAVIGVQGAVEEHIDCLNACNSNAIWARNVSDLEGISGAIIPGGESTTINKLMLAGGMHARLKEMALNGMPLLGTCAGAILLAKEGDSQTQKTGQALLGLMDFKVNRNAFGRQADSFEAKVRVPEIGKPDFPGVFIRAPAVEGISGRAEAFATLEGKPAGVRQGKMIALAFHPELSGDLRIHSFFCGLAKKFAQADGNAREAKNL
ncbi:MAG: pyridoxal 5'-phosphate synthase glutaminase subunit PdxT [Candidatus Diapherotrites archaeon]|nr:pyridoxal 5'-phosphate synthase glutaminase subunit PdxT [Candidatus Diapherotrites archaeon]